jgi:hypothetical protein
MLYVRPIFFTPIAPFIFKFILPSLLMPLYFLTCGHGKALDRPRHISIFFLYVLIDRMEAMRWRLRFEKQHSYPIFIMFADYHF